MEDPVEMDVKKERLLRLNKIWNDLALEKNKELVGQVLTVLVDGPSRKDDSVWCGYSDTNKLVNFKAEGLEQGMMADVRIDEAHTFSLNGTLVSVYNNLDKQTD